jgi:nitronate monooxygenase
VLDLARRGTLDVVTDPIASPTGFPFKILQLPDSLSQAELQGERRRQCDLGYLRHAYQRGDGSLGWRCPAERVDAYVQKGGAVEETVGRQCLCNALLANVGLAQTRDDGAVELPLVTSGDDVAQIARFLSSPDAASYAASYAASDVIAHLLSHAASAQPAAT